MINSLIQDFFEITSELEINSVIIGGLALPAYKVARTTLDIDIAIHITKQEDLNELLDFLSNRGIRTKQNPKIDHDLFTIFSKTSEAEVWLKPCDAFDWDEKMVENIIKFDKNIHVLAIEDFIMTKLARSDRSLIDHYDILQILISNINELDWDYLHFRLGWIGMRNDFEEILKAFNLDFDSKFQGQAQEILNAYENSKQK